MAPYCLVVTSGKGGVGKTTTSANLAVTAAAHGLNVVVIDADIGLRNLDVTLGLDRRVVFDLVQAVDGECRLREALIWHPDHPSLALLPASQSRDKNALRASDMQRVVSTLKRAFDVVIVDCPAGIEQGFRNALAAADRVLLVTTPDTSALRDADRILGLLESRDVPTPDLLINRYIPRLVDQGALLGIEEIEDLLGIPVIGVVPYDEEVLIAASRGRPVAIASDCASGIAYRKAAAQLFSIPPPVDQQTAIETGGMWLSFRRWIGLPSTFPR